MSRNQTWQQIWLLFNICFRILGYILNSHLFPFPFKDNFWQFDNFFPSERFLKNQTVSLSSNKNKDT